MATSLRPSSAHRARSRAACFLPRGFSLVELTIVLAIVAIISTMAMGRYWSSLGNYRAEMAARRIAQDLQLVQTRARATSSAQSFIINQISSLYRLPGEKPLRPGDPDMRVRLTDDPFNARILVFRSGAGLSTIKFDGYGTPDQSMQIQVGSGEHTRTVDMNASGVIRVTTP